MTIATELSVSTSEGDGATTSFLFDFYIPDQASMSVSLYDTTVMPSTLATLTPSLYLVAGFADPDGGAIQYPLSGDPVSSGQFVSIYRVAPLTQDIPIKSLSRFSPEAVEIAQARLRYWKNEGVQEGLFAVPAVSASGGAP